VAKVVARLLATAALRFQSRQLSKIQNGRHEQEWATNSSLPKTRQKILKVKLKLNNMGSKIQCQRKFQNFVK
jgi:hypothetical protein